MKGALVGDEPLLPPKPVRAEGRKTPRPEPVGARRHRPRLEERHLVADAPERVRLLRRQLLLDQVLLGEM
jgi:hypothetical protein